jgi:hypothetical protein
MYHRPAGARFCHKKRRKMTSEKIFMTEWFDKDLTYIICFYNAKQDATMYICSAPCVDKSTCTVYSNLFLRSSPIDRNETKYPMKFLANTIRRAHEPKTALHPVNQAIPPVYNLLAHSSKRPLSPPPPIHHRCSN